MRLFFALWPGAPAAGALERLAAEVVVVAGGKAVPRDRIHMTLSFLGEVDDVAGAREAALAIAAEARPFRVGLDCVGSFRRARVSWAGMLEPEARLAALQSRLESALRERGFALEERPFTPHVTLARKAERPLPRAAIPAIAWRANEITLMRSSPGTGEYAAIGAWRLGR